MRAKTNKIWVHVLALGASVAVNAAFIHGFAALRMDPWPAVFADATAKADTRPVASTAQAPVTDRLERVLVIGKRPAASDGVAMAQVPMPRSRDCPVPL